MHQGVAIGTLLAGMISCASAQWLNYRDPKTPRTKDGKANLYAPAPRSHGKLDLSGVWQTEPSPPEEMARLFPELGVIFLLGDDPRTFSKYERNVLADFKPEEAPIRPEAAALFETRTRSLRKDLPTSHCQPAGITIAEGIGDPFANKIVQMPGLIIMLYEIDGRHRQIYTDGRKQLPDPEPSWLGYSVGRWEADTLVVDTVGFNDRTWLDTSGHPHSEALHLTERFHRLDFGHMDLQITIEDPKMYTRPFTIKYAQRLLPDTDVLEFVCTENERTAPIWTAVRHLLYMRSWRGKKGRPCANLVTRHHRLKLEGLLRHLRRHGCVLRREGKDTPFGRTRRQATRRLFPSRRDRQTSGREDLPQASSPDPPG